MGISVSLFQMSLALIFMVISVSLFQMSLALIFMGISVSLFQMSLSDISWISVAMKYQTETFGIN
jgi:hypothetical protein